MTGRKSLVIGTFVAAALAMSLAQAADGMKEEQREAQGLAQTKISLVQAIQAAEQHVGGKAVSARLEHERDGYVYEVEVLQGGKATDVEVDAADGKVIRAKPDDDERERAPR